MVAVLTLDWDTSPMSENEGPLTDGLTVIGAVLFTDVLGSDGVEIYSFHSARGEPM